MNIKRYTKSLLLLLVVCLAFPLMSFTFMPLQTDAPVTVLDAILKIALGFASLAGVASAVTVLVQLFKWAGLVKDGSSSNWTSTLNLIAFIVLVSFRIFQPSIAVDVLDGYAAKVAEIAMFALGLFVQMTTSKPVYDALKKAQVPLMRYSLSA
jgi:hypothetical protein